MIGQDIYDLALRLWPLNRSITGDGVRQTISILKEILPNLNVHEIPTGEKVFDWTIPREWNARDAFIITPSGCKICDFRLNNLHLMGYSRPIDMRMSLSELQQHLHSLPDQPNAIPYITSYYKEDWGFCISQIDRDNLEEGEYHVYINATLENGSLTYADLVVKGDSDQEVLISTYICHPSMANNEISGIVVSAQLAKWIISEPRKYTYRFIFVPETIGSIAYLSKNIDHLKSKVISGYNVTCVGDERNYSYLPSRQGDTLSDKVAKHVLKHVAPDFEKYTWKDRGSDERQYCAPGVDLPIASIMRTKYGMYDEYHTSLDDLVNVVTPKGLEGGYKAIQLAIELIEANCYPKMEVLCEPQLSKRDLYPTLSTKTSYAAVSELMDLITWSDGKRSLLEIAELCNVPMWQLIPLVDRLVAENLLSLTDSPI